MRLISSRALQKTNMVATVEETIKHINNGDGNSDVKRSA